METLMTKTLINEKRGILYKAFTEKFVNYVLYPCQENNKKLRAVMELIVLQY